MSHHLIGAAEVARLLGVSRQRVAQLAVTEGFPPPEVELAAGRIWSREAIERWIGESSRSAERSRPIGIADLGPAGHHQPLVDELLRLAADESRRMGHDFVGVDHVVLAMLRPEAPGVAGRALASLGIDLGKARRATVERLGSREPSDGLQALTPNAQLVAERANLHAVVSADAVVSSQHVLLAVLDGGGGRGVAALDGIDEAALRQRLAAMGEGAGDDIDRANDRAEATADRRARIDAALAAKGTAEVELALRSDGVDQRTRKPWGSDAAVVEGAFVQWFVDADGVPVVSADGRLVHVAVDGDGVPLLDDEGRLVEVPLQLAPSEVQWPPGLQPPVAPEGAEA